jgi:mannitol operon repressor
MPSVDNEYQLALDYLHELAKETPRGAVIISCVVIGELLGKTIEAYLRDHKDVKGLLNGGVSAPLGTLSARILMALGLGLIDESEYKNLQILRKIRNHFAHNLHASFDDRKIGDLCEQLDASGFPPKASATPATKYKTIATYLIVLLTKRPMIAVGRRLGEKNWRQNALKYLREALAKQL